MSTSKSPEKGIRCLQEPLGRGPGVKQSVVGGLGVNRERMKAQLGELHTASDLLMNEQL